MTPAVRRLAAVIGLPRKSKPGLWRSFRKWAGFPVLEDVPCCSACGYRMTIGEWPCYDWVCPNVYCGGQPLEMDRI